MTQTRLPYPDDGLRVGRRLSRPLPPLLCELRALRDFYGKKTGPILRRAAKKMFPTCPGQIVEIGWERFVSDTAEFPYHHVPLMRDMLPFVGGCFGIAGDLAEWAIVDRFCALAVRVYEMEEHRATYGTDRQNEKAA